MQYYAMRAVDAGKERKEAASRKTRRAVENAAAQEIDAVKPIIKQKEVIEMKTILSILMAMAFVFALGSTFAGELSAGADLPDPYGNFFVEHDTIAGADPGGVREEDIGRRARSWEKLSVSNDLPDPYGNFFVMHKTTTAAAPGGLRAKADKGSEIFESLLGERGSRAETHIAY